MVKQIHFNKKSVEEYILQFENQFYWHLADVVEYMKDKVPKDVLKPGLLGAFKIGQNIEKINDLLAWEKFRIKLNRK